MIMNDMTCCAHDCNVDAYVTPMCYSVFSSLFYLKNFKFWPIILLHHAKFLVKRYSFFILDFEKKAKKLKSPHPPNEKFGILDGTKHTHKNFDILYFIIPK
jgi:hypothetical protein